MRRDNPFRVLALDVGSSSVKAGFWNGQAFQHRVRISYETVFSGAKAELDAETVLKAVVEAGKRAHAGSADAVVFCTLSSGVVVADRKGKVRMPIVTHQDRRSVAEARGLVERFGKGWLLKNTGNLPYPGGIGSSTLAWVCAHERSKLRGARVGQLSTLVGHLLTGEWVIDPSQATFLGLWNIESHQWLEPLCKALHVEMEALPRLVWADQVIGGLTAGLAKRWGMRAGVPVLGGFVDTSAAVLQTSMEVGQLSHSSGSTDVLAICVDEAKPAEGILTRPVGVGGGVFPQRWLAVRTIAAAGSALLWARRNLFSAVSDGRWEGILREACGGSKSLKSKVLCVPNFSGDRAAIEQEVGATFTGITLATTAEDILAGLVRGLTLESTKNYEWLATIQKPLRTVYSIGGATDLGEAMQREWPGKHRFERLPEDSLAGLVTLATRVLER